MDIITMENFLNDEDINLTNTLEGKEESFFDTEGVYKGKITSTQQWINPLSDFAKHMQNKFNTIEVCLNEYDVHLCPSLSVSKLHFFSRY